MEKKMDPEALNLLKRLGLNQYESKLYLALLSAGSTSASDSAAIAGIPRPRAYDVLEKLEKRGFIVSQPGRPVKFSAAPLDEAFSSFKKQKQKEHAQELSSMENIKKQLSKQLEGSEPEQNVSTGDFVWVLKDQQNIHSKIESLIDNAQGEIYIATPEHKLKNKLDTYSKQLQNAKERGVKIKISSNAGKDVIKKAKAIAHSVSQEQTHRMLIADDDVLLFLTPEDSKQEVASWIRSPYFSNNMKKLF